MLNICPLFVGLVGYSVLAGMSTRRGTRDTIWAKSSHILPACARLDWDQTTLIA